MTDKEKPKASDAEKAQAVADARTPTPKTESGEPQFIRVRGLPNEGRTILWERNVEHPTGEIFIREGEVCLVAPTTAVKQAMVDGKLVLAQEKGEKKAE